MFACTCAVCPCVSSPNVPTDLGVDVIKKKMSWTTDATPDALLAAAQTHAEWQCAIDVVDAAKFVLHKNKLVYICDAGDVRYYMEYQHGDCMHLVVANDDGTPRVQWEEEDAARCRLLMAAFVLAHRDAMILVGEERTPLVLFNGNGDLLKRRSMEKRFLTFNNLLEFSANKSVSELAVGLPGEKK